MPATPLSMPLVSLLLGVLPVGAVVPDFSAPNQDGKVISLGQLRGQPVLIYFYPKDDTPGCTKQACELRDRYERFRKAGVAILGVSRQDSASHRAFKAKHRLPFDLLTDGDGSIARALGVETIPLFGLHKRQSLVVAADGRLLGFLSDVDPSRHADDVLALVEKHDAPARDLARPADGG
jgi:peroxiredoxin Q/BCP